MRVKARGETNAREMQNLESIYLKVAGATAERMLLRLQCRGRRRCGWTFKPGGEGGHTRYKFIMSGEGVGGGEVCGHTSLLYVRGGFGRTYKLTRGGGRTHKFINMSGEGGGGH